MTKVLQIMTEPKVRHELTLRIGTFALVGSVCLSIAAVVAAFMITP